VSTFALIHGGDGSAWDWHLVAPALRDGGHDPVAVDLPSEDPSAGWWDSAAAVVEALGDRTGDLVVVGYSLGGFTAPLVCRRTAADLLVFVAGMIPAPGESLTDWWTTTGWEESGPDDVFYHDVPPDLAAEARTHECGQGESVLNGPCPADGWPDLPTRYLLLRDDRMFPAEWARRHARERLAIEPDEMGGGHYISLSRPRELAERLAAYASAAAT
jgi:hypothetical protein